MQFRPFPTPPDPKRIARSAPDEVEMLPPKQNYPNFNESLEICAKSTTVVLTQDNIGAAAVRHAPVRAGKDCLQWTAFLVAYSIATALFRNKAKRLRFLGIPER